MRISLLLEREPFGEILGRTLRKYWSHRYGKPYQVTWVQRGNGRDHDQAGVQTWYCNFLVNGLFTDQLSDQAFEPLRREFSHSLVAWRRPLQRTYVQLATRMPSARWLAQAQLRVRPAVPEADKKLIVPGNHKIRILDRDRKTVDVLLKDGFDPGMLTRELEAREMARDCGLSVPPVLEHDLESGWLRESYIVGTPVNRLRDQVRAKVSMLDVLEKLCVLHEKTMETMSWDAYVEDLFNRIVKAVEDASHLLGDRNGTVLEFARNLSAQAIQGKHAHIEIKLSMTHGDCQPANILLDGDQAWLIDWERTGRRFCDYDALVLELGARSPKGLSEKIARFVEQGELEEVPLERYLNSKVDGREERSGILTLFLLEDLLFHLQENGNPVFKVPSGGLMEYLDHAGLWMERGGVLP